MKHMILILLLPLSLWAQESPQNPSLRSPSDLELEVAIVSQLEVNRELIDENGLLTEVEKDILKAQADALLEKAREHARQIIEQRREIEKANGNYTLLAVGLGIGGSATPFKINFPKWIPAMGVGGEMSVGHLTAFTNGPKKLKFSTFLSRGVYGAIMPKTGKALNLKRSQGFVTVKLFFASPSILNPISKRKEFITFNDLNRNFYGGGKDSGWNLRIPKTNLHVLRESTSVQIFGAWIDDNEDDNPEGEVTLDESWWSRVGVYSLNLLERKSPDILMVSVNLGVKKDENLGQSYQFGYQKVDTLLDDDGQGLGFFDYIKQLF